MGRRLALAIAVPAAMGFLTLITASPSAAEARTVRQPAPRHVLASAFAWGADDWAQTGDSSLATRRVASAVRGAPATTAVVDTGITMYELASDGRVWAQGESWDGQTGQNPVGIPPYQASPAPVPGVPAVVQVAGNLGAGFARTANGQVWGWGDEELVGRGDTNVGAADAGPANVSDAVDLAAGGTCALAADRDGSVQEWGAACGDAPRNLLSPVTVAGLTHITHVAVGIDTFFAWNAAGRLWAWGDNSRGQLGLAVHTMIDSPTVVTGIPPVASISTLLGVDLQLVGAQTLERTTTGQVWSWGAGTQGQLGTGGTPAIGAPAVVPGVSGAVSVAAGAGFSLAATASGRVYAWGTNQVGELGDGSTALRSLLPERTTRLAGVIQVAAGGESAAGVARAQPLSVPPGVITPEGSIGASANNLHQLLLTMPRGPAGLLAIADIYTACHESADPPAGWSTIGHLEDTASGGCGAEWIYEQRTVAGEEPVQDFSLPDGNAAGGVIVTFYGTDPTRPLGGFAGTAATMTQVPGGFNAITPPALTSSVPFSYTVSLDAVELNTGIESAGDQLGWSYTNVLAALSIDGATVRLAGTSPGITDETAATQFAPRAMAAQLLLNPAPQQPVS